MRRRAPLLAALVLLACGTDPVISETVATLLPVRGEVVVDGENAAPIQRLSIDEGISLGEPARARLTLDGGARVLLGDGAEVTLSDTESLALASGRLFAEVHEDQRLVVRFGESEIRLHDAGASIVIEDGAPQVYLLRGEVSWRHNGERGVLGAGRTLTLDEDGARTEATSLFDDWTNGLTQPGPVGSLSPEGVGVLSARVPDEVGQARWPLVVRRMDVRVLIDGDLAVTEVDQVFFNPASEALEGYYTLRVPEDAVLSRFAVDRDGVLVDGYVRERGLARREYERQVYRGSTDDPALLEWRSPGSYRARIYPIRPGETRRIVIRYGQWLTQRAGDDRRLYRYPMGAQRDAPRIAELSLVVDLSDANTESVRAGLGASIEEGAVRLRRSDFAPDSDFWLELIGGTDATRASQHAWRGPHGRVRRANNARAITNEEDERDYWFLPLVIPEDLLDDADGDAPGGLDMVIVADLSAGTDRAQLELAHSAVESLAALLDEGDRLAVVGGDLGVRALGEHVPALGDVTAERLDALLTALARQGTGGATDLGTTIEQAAALLDPERRSLIVYVGDGHATVGERTGARLLDRWARLPHPIRLYAFGTGADADHDMLATVTRGGGRSFRVEERREAAQAALELFAHARRPVAHRVTVDLGDGIANAFPRRPVDAVLGDVLAVVGRVAEEPPSSVWIRGVVSGEEFEREVPVLSRAHRRSDDLRLRWASARLSQLMLEDASREEIAELGVRYGLITPYTSYYVPSARELREMRTGALRLIDRPDVFAAARTPQYNHPYDVVMPLDLVFGIAGCADISPSAEPALDLDTSLEPTDVPSASAADAPIVPAPAPATVPPIGDPSGYFQAEDPEPEAAEAAEGEIGSGGAPPAAMAPSMDPAPQPAMPMRGARVPHRPRRRPTRMPVEQVVENTAPSGANPGGCASRAIDGVVAVSVTIGPDGRVTQASIQRSIGDASIDQCVLSMARSMSFEGTGQTYTRVFTFRFNVGSGGPPRSLLLAQLGPWAIEMASEEVAREAHRRRRCSDAARLRLTERRTLWRERLSVTGWGEVRRAAILACEVPTWRARRALLHEILRHAGSVTAMIGVYHSLSSNAERSVARVFVFSRVRSAEDLRAIRHAFGEAVDFTLIEQILERARTPRERVRQLRRVVAQYPRNIELELRLLDELENAERLPEARRLAAQLRRDPLADASVRTAIGELLLRLGERDEARRVFSEIVEFAPLDELARRRLGDLFRARGWYEDAYRQYLTLQDLRPDDASVLLLLAQAAAGAGRVDEALRLEARVAQTEAPGAGTGLARTALLWSSVRYAAMRLDADEDRVGEVRRQLRRSGVMSRAVELRVTLTFAHPDAQISLWAGHPGERPTRPRYVAPELGIEAFEAEEQSAGVYVFEARRQPGHAASREASITILWNEGRADEQIRIIPIELAADESIRAFRIEGTTLIE